MEYELDKMMGFDTMDLNYEAHIVGLDGECFTYSVYIAENDTANKKTEIINAIAEWDKPFNEKDIYTGYINVSEKNGIIIIFLDLGNVEPEYQNISIKGILESLNNVTGIESVLINEY